MIYITTEPSQDGYGARFQRMLQLIFLSKHIKDKYNVDIEYVHTPFSYEDSTYKFVDFDRRLGHYFHTSEDYRSRAKIWDDKINYNGIYKNDIEYDTVVKNVNFDGLFEKIKIKTTNKALLIMQNVYPRIESIIDIYETYKDDVISCFNMKNNYNQDKKNVAIHIRRDDAINFKERWLTDEYYLNLIDMIEQKMEDFNINIYTQKSNFNFEKYKNRNVTVKYDSTSEDYNDFIDLVFSDIFIMGKSSFSYAAALLNKNVIIYPPNFYCKKVNGWLDKI